MDFRNHESDAQFIYDTNELFIFRYALTDEDPYQYLKIPAGEYSVYVIMSNHKNIFLLYNQEMEFWKGTTYQERVTVKPGEALYVGDYTASRERDTIEGLIHTEFDNPVNNPDETTAQIKARFKELQNVKLISIFK